MYANPNSSYIMRFNEMATNLVFYWSFLSFYQKPIPILNYPFSGPTTENRDASIPIPWGPKEMDGWPSGHAQ